MSYFDNINLEKGMYQSGKNLTEVLNEIDPSENYRGTPFEGLDAFERQLKRFDIKINGSNSDTVEKFYSTYQTACLFPEYVRRKVEAGMDENPTVKEIVATTTAIDGLDYRSISAKGGNDKSGGTTPLQIKVNDKLCKIHRRGRSIVTSYESLRFQRLDVFSIILKQIGNYIRKMQLFDLIDILEHLEPRKTRESYKIAEKDVHDLVSTLGDNGFNLDILLVSTGTVVKLKQAFENTLRYEKDGMYLGGMKIIPTYDRLLCELAGIDSNSAIEMVEAGGIDIDYDKAIDRQLEKLMISACAGFSFIHPDAVRIMEW